MSRDTFFRSRHSGAHRRCEPGISRFRVRCFASPRNDIRQTFALAGHDGPEAISFVSLCNEEGAGNAGCPMHPQPRARWVVKYAHEYSQRRHRKTSGIPHAMVLRCMACSPRRRIRLATVVQRIEWRIKPGWIAPPRNLTPATGARTTRFDRPQHCRSSCAPLSIAHDPRRPATSCAHDTVASTASRPTFRDDWP